MKKELFSKIVKWHSETFALASTKDQVVKLIEEARELYESIGSPMENSREELADCFIVLISLANLMGYTLENIGQIVEEKHQINRTRTWYYRNGVYKK